MLSNKYKRGVKLEILTVVAMLAMAGATFWLGWETKGLKLIDIGPNISISDIAIESVDDVGNLIKKRSWREGELINPGSTPSINLGHTYLLTKFSNTGKDAGYVKAATTSDVYSFLKLDEFYLVPAGGETGWIFSIDIVEYIKKIIEDIKKQDVSRGGSYHDFKYIFEIYDSDLSYKDTINITIRCEGKEVETGFFDYRCVPLKSN